MVLEGGISLGNPKKISREIFFSTKEEEELDSFIIAVAAWFNDLKTYQLHALQAEEKLRPHIKSSNEGKKFNYQEEMELRLANSHYNHALRLIASHIVELFETIKMNLEVLKHPTFLKAANSISKERQIYLDVIIRCATDDFISDETTENFLKLKKLFIRMRASGTYHYNKLKYFKKGYLHYYVHKEENEPYYCLTESPGGTRFFFADRVQQEIFEELATHDPGAINEFSGLAQHAIKDLVESYISVKEKALREQRIEKWTFKKI